ncbi:MAG: hypothetical protein ACKO7W_00105 [Elainella sp.]
MYRANLYRANLCRIKLRCLPETNLAWVQPDPFGRRIAQLRRRG